jgi:hypothetical protein
VWVVGVLGSLASRLVDRALPPTEGRGQ